MRSRDDSWHALDSAFKTFMDCLGQLTEEELTTTAVVGEWTVKDVVAHVWSWADEALYCARAWDGPRPWQQGVSYDDAWNEMHVAERRALPLITVVDGVTGSHRRLMHFVDGAGAAQFATSGRAPWGVEMTLGEFLCDIADHYVEHAHALKQYQEHCLDCD